MKTTNLQERLVQELSTRCSFFFRRRKEAAERESSKACIHAIIPVLLCAVAEAGLLTAQEPPRQNNATDSVMVLRQTVRRVRVDVVVTDGLGHTVKGLQASDFRLAEDGKPQSPLQFEYHDEENAVSAFPKRPPLPPHTFMNLPTVPEHGRLTVLLYDILNTPLEDQPYARKQMLEFLKKNPGGNVAVFVLGDRLRLLQGFTSDTEQLERAANGAGTGPQRPNLVVAPPSHAEALSEMAAQQAASPLSPMGSLGAGMSGDMSATLQRAAARMAALEAEDASFRLDRRTDMTLDALAQLGRFLAGIEGRKNLIWFSGSIPANILPDPEKSPFQPSASGPTDTSSIVDPMSNSNSSRNYTERMRIATNLLNASQVAVYPVDARGLQTDATFTAGDRSRTGASGQASTKAIGRFSQKMASEHGTMDFLGEQTGGRAFYNTNGLEQALETAAHDGNSYYSLVYAPTNTKYDGAVRRIAVHLDRGHYHLAYRRSYFADDVTSETPKQIAEDRKSASDDKAGASGDLMAADSQFGAPSSHQLVFAARLDAIGASTPATPEQMAALMPYREQAAKADHKKFAPPTAPVAMQQYVIQFALLASQLEIPKSANGVYHSDLSIAMLAFDKDGETMWGTATRLKDEIPAKKFIEIRGNGYQAVQSFFIPADTAAIRLVVHDENSGRIGSMEVRLPLPPDRQQGTGAN